LKRNGQTKIMALFGGLDPTMIFSRWLFTTKNAHTLIVWWCITKFFYLPPTIGVALSKQFFFQEQQSLLKFQNVMA
jgi:hypothetical protein